MLVIDINDADGEKVAAGINERGGRAMYQRIDVRLATGWKAAVQRAEEELGQVEMLVSDAFVISQAALADLCVNEWRTSLDINLTGRSTA